MEPPLLVQTFHGFGRDTPERSNSLVLVSISSARKAFGGEIVISPEASIRVLIPESGDIIRVMRQINFIPSPFLTLGVEKKDIDVRSIPARIIMCTGSFPDDLISELIGSKNCIQENLEKVSGSRI